VTASTALTEAGTGNDATPVAANSHDLEELTRPLLEALAALGGLDSTYLIVFDWDRREQEVRLVHSAGERSITKGSRLPLPDTVFQESLPGVTRSSAQMPETFPDAQAAKHLGLGTYVSVPIVLAKHELYGMLSGASRRAQPVGERLVSAMEFFAQMIAEHVSRTQVAATEQRADLAEAELRARARFLAIAEHQLKTPLTAIQGAAEVLHARWADLGASTRDQFLDIIVRNARDLSTGFTGLLVEARADVRSRELVPVEVDLNELVQSITRELDAVCAEHQVRAEIEQGLITYADPTALCQVLGHLLDNAVKYSPAEGVITVVGYGTVEGVAVVVVDEGSRLPDGIDIFEAFQRGDSSRVDAAPGIGLGLHIVRTLVEAMGGSVTAQSDAEAGTRFTVSLQRPAPPSGPPLHPCG
jgi:K+-sensing histidine kinase KdpD